ncbi:MAG: RNA polymerase factor sigma-54, partial [Rhodospirillales bacterium]|nr:RNA polymerase factor sigma-54 [Rhodospirillales bacterium]
MVMTPRLEQRLGQSLVMTPQLQQAIKMLQLSNFELNAYVEEELERNPLLKRDDDGESGGENSGEETVSSGENSGEVETDGLPAMDFSSPGEPGNSDGAALDADYDNVWTNDSASDAGEQPAADRSTEPAFAEWGGRGGSFDDGLSSLEETLTETESLRDHLMAQLNLDLHDPVDRVIGLHLIDMLDGSGYLPRDLSPVAEQLGCGLDRVEATLLKLQNMDPAGIFARDLGECLALQLKDRDRLDPAMQALLDNLDLLGKRDFAQLMKLTGEDSEGLAEMIAEIRTLNPKPGQAFELNVAQPVTPDVLMRSVPGGGWVVELNNDTLPRVLLNNQYIARVNREARNREDKQYINECLQSANWLVKSLHQRATTILKVATEIVRQQELFFIKGVGHLRPLVLRDIAEVIDMHESTVSRVTSNKYIATPRGIYELKYFFTTAIGSSSGGDSHSAESVRHRIKALIDGESADAILSDDKIVEILKNENV